HDSLEWTTRVAPFFVPSPRWLGGKVCCALIAKMKRLFRREASLLENPLIEVVQDTCGNAPNVTVPVRNFIIVARDAVPVAALALVIIRSHHVFEGGLEHLGDFEPVERQLKIRDYPRYHRQNAKAAEGQIEVEIPERLDQRRRQADFLLGLTQCSPCGRFVTIDLAARKGDLAGMARQLGG